MPATVGLVTGNAVGRSGLYLMARIRGVNGSLITQASLSTVAYVVSNLTAGTTGDSTSLTIGDVVFDSLQTDSRWTKDDTGYNFAMTLPATSTNVSTLTEPVDSWDEAEPARVRYRVDVVFTPVTGQPWRVPFEFLAINVYG